MVLVSGIVDDSIKSVSTVYDIKLFRSFTDFAEYVETVPIVVDVFVISTNELAFNGPNISRFMRTLESPFLDIKGKIIYLLDEGTQKDMVSKFVNERGLSNWVLYQGELNIKFITDIVTGDARQSSEGVTDIVTYRMRAKEFVQQQNELRYQTEDEQYYTDEDKLQGIPDEPEPDQIIVPTEETLTIDYIVGSNTPARTILSYLMAQYRTMTGKTIIIERDAEYHRLTDWHTKVGVESLFITMDEVFSNIESVISKIHKTSQRLIVIGAVRRIEYDYNFIFDLIYNNCRSAAHFIVKECDLAETPHNRDYILVCGNTVPDILDLSCNLRYEVDPRFASFVGLQTVDIFPATLSTDEFKTVMEKAVQKNNLRCEVFKVRGLQLREEGGAYDLFSVLSRNHSR
jgi:hypothetical protein